MDYNSINNCMSDQQKLSLAASALNQMVRQEPKTYDEINDKMTDQQKLSLIAAALQELKDNSGGGGKVLTLHYTESDIEFDELWGIEYGVTAGLVFHPTVTDENGSTYTLDDILEMYNNGEKILLKNVPLVVLWNGDYDDPVVDLNNSMVINTEPSYYAEWEDPGYPLDVKILGGSLDYMDVTQYDMNNLGGLWDTEFSSSESSAYWKIERVVDGDGPHIGLFVEALQVS